MLFDCSGEAKYVLLPGIVLPEAPIVDEQCASQIINNLVSWGGDSEDVRIRVPGCDGPRLTERRGGGITLKM